MSKYLDAGVNIDLADGMVEDIKSLSLSAKKPGIISDIGGFGAVFDPFAEQRYNSPVLVSSTDGVGTKLLVAQKMKMHKSVGVDLVAMCANDILAQGAKPLFFLDYFSTGSLDREVTLEVISGIVEGCKHAGMSLVGGETAEMPGMYSRGHYDLAGFSVGIAEKSEILPRTDKIRAGDILIGLYSSGLHSNGFSLVRKVLRDLGINYSSAFPSSKHTWAEILLEPTKIYVRAVLPVVHMVKAAAHITGGGLLNNIPRVLPEHLAAKINSRSWSRHSIFEFLEHEAKIPHRDMIETFNCGIGFVLIVGEENVNKVRQSLAEQGEDSSIIGEILPRKDLKVIF